MAIWAVSTYYKKSCEEHEYWTKDGQTIIHKTGWRWAGFTVETTDDNPPEFEFDFVPGGDGKKDSIDMYNCPGSNIDNVELDSMTDGCWDDIEWPEDMDEEERERLQELIDEEGIYGALEDQEGWMLDETQAWCWGPIQSESEDGKVVRIVIADDDGNAIEFKED